MRHVQHVFALSYRGCGNVIGGAQKIILETDNIAGKDFKNKGRHTPTLQYYHHTINKYTV